MSVVRLYVCPHRREAKVVRDGDTVTMYAAMAAAESLLRPEELAVLRAAGTASCRCGVPESLRHPDHVYNCDHGWPLPPL